MLPAEGKFDPSVRKISETKIQTMTTAQKGTNLTIRLNDFNLSYDDLGEGDLPIFFLHGFPFDKNMWESQLHFLKESHRVIACDIRGFGKSKDEKTPLSIGLFGDDLIEFMDALHLEKIIICGLSMGGFIALNAQERFPERFEALILCDTQCVADTTEIKEKRHRIIDEIKATGANDFNAGFLISVFHKDSLSTKKELVEKLRNVVFANSENIILQGLFALADRFETCTTLDKITIPTLIICGREDSVTPLAQSEYLYRNIDKSILRIIDHAGHVSNLEQPEEFNQHLAHFLTSLRRVNIESVNNQTNR